MNLLERFQLSNKVALVTGAGMGIGEAVALAMAEAGADVVCNARTRNDIDRTAKAIRKFGRRSIAVAGDVTKANDMDKLVEETLAEFGRIDILVNNAGGIVFNGFLDISDDEFSFNFDWNTKSAFMLSRRAVPHMLKRDGGVILNISSAVGHITARGMLSYAVAKAALDHLTRSMADELAPKIRVNALALGSIMTPALQRTMFEENPEMGKVLQEKTPLRRIGNAANVGAAAVFLCSEAAEYMTGAVVPYDGGLQDTNLPYRLPDL